MDLSAIMTKIDTHKYTTAKDFLKDVDLICSNALEYNPDKDPGGTRKTPFVFKITGILQFNIEYVWQFQSAPERVAAL